jgi:hypothetical protein
VVSSIAGLLRLASVAACAIVIASFAMFVVDKSSGASKHQQAEIAGVPATSSTSAPTAPATKANSSKGHGAVRKAIDEASSKLTSPFAGVISASSDQWAIRGVKLALALVVYGFGLGYIARYLRVRA